MAFRVQLDLYYGPMDLLLHLVRKQEVPIERLPLANLTEQYLQYVVVLEQLDVDSIGEFLEVASTLIELKSRMVLPQVEVSEESDSEEILEDPKGDLVQRLLEYKKFRDAASELETRGIDWSRRRVRVAPDAPRRKVAPDEQPIQQVELWDLVCAFGRVIQEKLEPAGPATIEYDETPVHVYMGRVHQRLVAENEVLFSDLFPASVHKSTLIATFLAVMELVRHRHALADQSQRYGDLLLRPGAEPLLDPNRVQISVAEETT